MNKFRYTFIFLILISLFPCYGILANEETNNVAQQKITKNTEKKNTTKNVTEITNTSITENEPKESTANIKTQQKKISFKMIVSWTYFLAIVIGISLLIGWIVYGLLDLFNLYFFDTGISYLFRGINFILSIVIKVFYKKSFFWSATISVSIVLAIILIITAIVSIILQIISKNKSNSWQKAFDSRINKLSNRLLNVNLKDFDDICADYHKYHNSLNKIEEEIKKKKEKYEKITPGWFSDGGKQECLDEINNLECNKEKLLQSFEQIERNVRNFIDLNDVSFYMENNEKIKFRIEELQNEQIKSIERQKQLAYEQLQNEAATQAKASEDEMKKNEVERNIGGLGDYIDMLGKAIQKEELPDVQIVSELSKMLDSIFNSKSYISKESIKQIRNDNEVFEKHIFNKIKKISGFKGSLVETRINQARGKFKQILK